MQLTMNARCRSSVFAAAILKVALQAVGYNPGMKIRARTTVKMSKRLVGIIGCKYNTSSWYLNGFPYVV